jgi:peptidoglycan hydrolase CwlO-like protein
MSWFQTPVIEEPSAFAEILSVGGPISGVLAAIGFLTKIWFDSRKDKREDKASDRQSESGIVETTSAALKMVRDEMQAMGQDIAVLRQQVKDRDGEIEKLQNVVREQAGEIAVLRSELNRSRGQHSE